MNNISFSFLTTQRLELTQLEKTDIDALFKLRTHPKTNEFIKRELPKEVNELVPFIEKITKGVLNNEYFYWAIKKDQQLIGTICLWNFSEDKLTAEIGYELHPDFHKKGFMSESLQKVIHFGFSKLNLKAIEAFTHKNNESSIALLNKNNFIYQPKRRDKGFENNRIFRIENN
ncbi:GNAT family N-acetyltransferase [Tenacibaculum aiptasiae]|uniref:GNAT family N-acetyltransferase n=1 Tax=Tenacibaculum aiptasiae TaxID=426481 RepID=UPI003B5C91C6